MAEASGFDKRVTPVRADLAAAHLKGKVDAPRFAQGTTMQVTASVLPIRRTPAPDGAQETQALFGETFTIYDEAEGWGWGQAALDGYVGYVDMEGLSAPVVAPTHRITALRSYRFSEPNLKSAPLGLVSMNAKIAAGETDGDFVQEARGGWVWRGHTAPIDAEFAIDPVEAAMLFLAAPYFWGGRESLGLDCSALIQNAFEACGHVVPRDTDQQEAYFQEAGRSETVWDEAMGGDWADAMLQRGDILFWPGHTALMVDDRHMLHANATYMATTINDARELSAKWVVRDNLKMRRIVRPKI